MSREYLEEGSKFVFDSFDNICRDTQCKELIDQGFDPYLLCLNEERHQIWAWPVLHKEEDGALIQALKDQPMARIRVILVCRAAEWDAEQGNKLDGLWRKPPLKRTVVELQKASDESPARQVSKETVWELCPLSEGDAKMAADASGTDPKAFLGEVRQLHVEALAARPITLKMLLEEFQEHHTFRQTYYELFKRSILRMCQEVNDDRAKWVDPFPDKTHIYVAASRLAACLTLGRKSIIVKVDKSQANAITELKCSEVLGEDVVGSTPLAITFQLLACVLDTPLFSFRGSNYGFEQKTYADFLAADYVKNCSVEQLRSLFCNSIHGRELVTPRLAETAAWVAIADDACGIIRYPSGFIDPRTDN